MPFSARLHRLKVYTHVPTGPIRRLKTCFLKPTISANPMAKVTGCTKHFQNASDKIATDYDREDIAPASDRESNSEDSEDNNVGTEHYIPVSKSRLRQNGGATLGADYRGSRVSRTAWEHGSEIEEGEDEDKTEDDTEYHDPESFDIEADRAQVSDEEIDSDNAFVDSDAERFNGFTFRGSSRPVETVAKAGNQAQGNKYLSSSDEEEEVEAVLEDGSESGSELNESDGDTSKDADDDVNGTKKEVALDSAAHEESEGDNEKARSISENLPAHASALSADAEVKKGTAIKKQRQIYDGLLNLRIRLQKALVAANTLHMIENETGPDTEPYEAAEEAAVKLLNTISSLRDNFAATSRADRKRKREFSKSASTEEILECLLKEDQQSAHFRRDRLEKWSRKVQSVHVTTVSGLGQRNIKNLVGSLEEQLAYPNSRLVKRTRVPRSCAPAQVARNMTEDEKIYDDADFYQLLLKELVDQRTVETAGTQTSAVPTVMMTATKEAKTRRPVERKASKGRKMRFTVHEKLQNLMAPEDRRSWEQGAIDRFFGTLFGRKMELNEEESEHEEMEDVSAEAAGLRLFRS